MVYEGIYGALDGKVDDDQLPQVAATLTAGYWAAPD